MPTTGSGLQTGVDVTSSEVLAALRLRHAPPQWYLLSEVANGTGYKGKARETYADAVAINAYQTGKYGQEIHGFEIKVTRPDWQSELKDPEKSTEVRKFCDRWYVVTPEDIVHPGELPKGWGHIVMRPDPPDVLLVVEAVKSDAALSRAFVAALVRRASEERADKEALKGALLKAPLRQVVKSPHRGLHVLVCGHLMPAHASKSVPKKSMRCLACVDGLPPTSELVLEGLKAMTLDDAQAVLVKAQASLKVRERFDDARAINEVGEERT